MKKLLSISLTLLIFLSATAQANNNLRFSCSFKNYTKQPILISVISNKRKLCRVGDARNTQELKTVKSAAMLSDTCSFFPKSNTIYKVTVIHRGQPKGDSLTLPIGNIQQVKNIHLRYITKTWEMTCHYSH